MVGRRQHYKLSLRYYGPSKILERIGKVAYRLDLPENSKIHPTFHVSLLKLHHRLQIPNSLQLPTEAVDHQPIIQPLVIVDQRISQAGEREVLVQWEGLPSEDATWESWSQLLADYPDLYLEDKVSFEGEGDDRNLFAAKEDQRAEVDSPGPSVSPGRPSEGLSHPSVRQKRVPFWLKDYEY